MNTRERFLETVLFGKPDYPCFHHSFGLMPGVIDRWHKEGLPEKIEEDNIRSYFGFDLKGFAVPVNTQFYPPIESRVMEETGEYVIRDEGYGKITKIHKDVSTGPLIIKFPIEKPENWWGIKEAFKYSKGRFAQSWVEEVNERREQGLPISFGGQGFYWMPRDLMGDEKLCLWYYENPEIIKDILRTYTNLLCQLAEEVTEKVQVDMVAFAEDMAYRGGSMISPKTFREFMLPCYRKVFGVFQNKGIKVFSIDSDGRLDGLIPLFIEAGVALLRPMEVRAGNDIVEYRKQYGKKMAFLGGLDKLVLSKEKDAINKELECKIPEMLKLGGYIPSLDHRVVVETPLENFTFYVRRVKELIAG